MKAAHLIEVTYLGATNTKGSRMKLKSLRFGDSILLPNDNRYFRMTEQAENYLKAAGYKIVCYGETDKGYIIATDTFESLKATKLKKNDPYFK